MDAEQLIKGLKDTMGVVIDARTNWSKQQWESPEDKKVL